MAKVIAKSDTHAGLRDKLNTALKAKHNATSSYSYDDPYVSDVTDDKVIHSMPGEKQRGKLFASTYKKDAEGNVTLPSDPKEVEQAYKPLSESERGIVMEAADTFAEAAMTSPSSKTRELTVTVIKPGFNKSKGRFYSSKALRETGHIFEGAKVFINHATKAEESARPEGRVQDWAGTLTGNIWEAKDGSLKSKCIVHNGETVKMLDALKEAGKLGELGMSIRAAGVQTPATVQGVKTLLVEAFVACKSVDMVTFPGAGGKVDSMAESDGQHILTEAELEAVFSESEANDIDLMPLSILRERRPDLVQSITKEVRESINMEKTVEQLQAELKESQEATKKAQDALTLVESTGKKSAVKTELDSQLKESGLPEVSQKRIRAQFAEATEVTGIKEAVEAERTYLKEAGIAVKPGVRGLGEMREAGDPAAKQTRADYITAMSKTPGFTKEMAEASADHLGL
jgi:DNA-binding protein YbaB